MSASLEVTRKRPKTRGYKKRLLEELREHVQRGIPHDLVFKPLPKKTTKKEREALQNSLNYSFDLW